jgi:hypothetical protein
MPSGPIEVNRAPVLTLWAAIVAERLGFDRAEALSLGKAVAGLNAQLKGRGLGIFTAGGAGGAPAAVKQAGHAPKPPAKGTKGAGTEVLVLLERHVTAARTPQGLRALAKDRPIEPASVEKALATKFGDRLDDVRAAMEELAEAFEPDDLAARGFALYERFRPAIPPGVRGWGAKGTLDLAKIRRLAAEAGRG